MGNVSDHKLILTLLGSGTCVPSLKRSSCSVLVKVGNGNLLFDVGRGTIDRLMQIGTSLFDVTHIFLSHFHPDHTGELVSFLFSKKHITLNRRETPLTLVGGEGFITFFERLKSAYGSWIELGSDLTLSELSRFSSDHFEGEGFSLSSLPMYHSPESVGYRISVPEGPILVYTGDTDTGDNVISLAKGADLLICEASFPDDLKKTGHLTPSQAGEIATKAGVKRLILTHFYPECEGVDIEAECRKTYTGPLDMAKDLMEIVVG